MDPHSRATQIVTSADQEGVSQILEQLQKNEHINAFFVLSKFIDCNSIKNEPQFCQTLFQEHIEVVNELLDWMLIPKSVAARKKIKTNIDTYPCSCRDFMRDNWCFYEQMYIAARNKKIQFANVFNFLRKDYFNKDTIFTALGYFTDVMIPFAKYEFSGSFNLTKSLQVASTGKNAQTLSIMKILPEDLIDQLIAYSHYEPIYQFLKTSILVSIEDPRDYEICRSVALKLMSASKIENIFSKFPIQSTASNDNMAKTIEFLQNLSSSLKEMTQNIEATNSTQLSFRTFAIIQVVLQSGIIRYSVQQLGKSRLCGVVIKQRDRLHSSANINELSASTQLNRQNLSTSTPINLTASPNTLPAIGAFATITDHDEEQVTEILLRILSSAVQIFIRIPRTINVAKYDESKTAVIVSPQAKQNDPQNAVANRMGKQRPKQMTYQQYSAMTSQFREQMQFVLNGLEIITKLVYNEGQSVSTNYSKIIPFSSGQNVKAISFMKLQYFKLLHNCLLMIQCKDVEPRPSVIDTAEQPHPHPGLKKMKSITLVPFEMKIQKIFPLQIIKKYLNENRWNNLAHHLLEKVCHLLILHFYDYIKKSIDKQKNNKFLDSFLAYLIQSFTKRDFIFLNTVKFTPQGNLHSLYNISKDLAYTLNSTNQLVLFLNQFEPWKKFIMTDLKNYQERAYPRAIKPELEENNQDQSYNLKVDQVDSIKKLIQNISTTRKWPTKTKNKSMSRSGVYKFSGASNQDTKTPFEKGSTSKKIQNFDTGLEGILKKKMQLSKKGSINVGQFDVEQISVRKKLEGKDTQSLVLESTKSFEVYSQKQVGQKFKSNDGT